MRIFESIPVRFLARIGGAKDGIGVSDEWGIQRTDGLQLSTVKTPNCRNGEKKKIGGGGERVELGFMPTVAGYI